MIPSSNDLLRALAKRGFIRLYVSPQGTYQDFVNSEDQADYITAAWLDGAWQLDRFTARKHVRLGYAANRRELRELTRSV